MYNNRNIQMVKVVFDGEVRKQTKGRSERGRPFGTCEMPLDQVREEDEDQAGEGEAHDDGVATMVVSRGRT